MQFLFEHFARAVFSFKSVTHFSPIILPEEKEAETKLNSIIRRHNVFTKTVLIALGLFVLLCLIILLLFEK